MSAEYSQPTSAGSPCSYAKLQNYNQGWSTNIAPQGKVTSGTYIVPSWSNLSYNSLTSDVPTCYGYPSIENAYGSKAANCQTTYRTSLCNGR